MGTLVRFSLEVAIGVTCLILSTLVMLFLCDIFQWPKHLAVIAAVNGCAVAGSRALGESVLRFFDEKV